MNINFAIGLVVLISVLHYSIMGYAGFDPSPEAESLMQWSLIILFAWWAHADAKKQNYHRPYEFGAFIFFAWPIVLPAYLVATRGLKGFLIFSIFIFLYLLPWLMGWALYYFNP